jgi:hypothetical protein
MFLPIAVVLALAAAALAATGCDQRSEQTARAVITVSAPPVATPERQDAMVYEGRIKDVRPAISLLILTVGKEKDAQDRRFDIGEARIVGPSGNEWKGGDLQIGDRVRLTMADNDRLVQQINVLPVP